MKDGQKVRVRLIGINAPESVDPRRPVQCFGKEASAEMSRIVGGQSVRLETDPSQDTYDKYGRLLAYAFLPDGTDVNLHMVEAGYAYEYTYHLPYRYQKEFKAAQTAAEKGGSGLWAAGVCGH
jgi:micrococcal nuclease